MLVPFAGAVLAIDQSAITTGFAGDLDSKVQWLVRFWIVLSRGGDREPCFPIYVLTHAKVGWSPVTHTRTISAPDTSFGHCNTLVVNVVLSGSRVSVVPKIGGGIRACQGAFTVGLCVQRHNLVFGTCMLMSVPKIISKDNLLTRVIGTTDSGISRQLIVNRDSSCPLDAELFRQMRIGQSKLALRVASKPAD